MFVSFEVEYNDNNIQQKIRRFVNVLQGSEGKKRAERVQKAARLDCGFDTGALAASIRVVKVAQTIGRDTQIEVWSVGSELDYAEVVHEGVSHSYPIVAHRGKLRYVAKDGVIRFGKMVIHPGFKGKYYLTKNLWRAVA
jgi:hypothetical protein